MKIEILGTSCAKCKSLAKNVEKAVSETGVQADVIKVDSIQEIMNRGIMMIPALVIDGETKSIGKALSVEDVKKLLKQ